MILMGNSNVLVRDSCLRCDNLSEWLENGNCSCGYYDIAKGKLSPSEVSWLRRHGRLQEIEKPYRYKMTEIEEPLRRVLINMQNLVNEGEKLCTVTKAISEDVRRKSRKRKVKNLKLRVEYTVSGLEKSKQNLLAEKKKMLKRNDDAIMLNILDGLKGRKLENWIEKKAGLR
jgi:hypothetical protein